MKDKTLKDAIHTMATKDGKRWMNNENSLEGVNITGTKLGQLKKMAISFRKITDATASTLLKHRKPPLNKRNFEAAKETLVANMKYKGPMHPLKYPLAHFNPAKNLPLGSAVREHSKSFIQGVRKTVLPKGSKKLTPEGKARVEELIQLSKKNKRAR